MKIGNPVESMLAVDLGGSDSKFAQVIKKHKGRTIAEVKYDGYRLQVHKDGEVSLFTRGLNQLDSRLFPDIVKQVLDLPRGIYDGELLGLGSRLDAFNDVKRRVRGEFDQSIINSHPLQLRFFDILQFERKELVGLPLTERRVVLEKYVDNVSQQFSFEEASNLKDNFFSITDQGYEGFVCKRPDSLYLPGGRTSDWIKLKRFITLDLAVLGIYKGEGKASELPFAAVLMGAKNGQNYESIVKVGISNKDLINNLYGKISSGLRGDVPCGVILSPSLEKKSYSRKVPFQYVDPASSAVLEIKCLDVSRSKNWHSCGLADEEAYSLRIASIEKIREDKLMRDVTTTAQIAEIYSTSQ